MFKNSDTGLCYVKSVNTESITREEYEVTRNMKDRQTNRSSAGVKARAWREFCGLVPGAQIEFVTEYTNGPFITVEKGTKGYVIEKK